MSKSSIEECCESLQRIFKQNKPSHSYIKAKNVVCVFLAKVEDMITKYSLVL